MNKTITKEIKLEGLPIEEKQVEIKDGIRFIEELREEAKRQAQERKVDKIIQEVPVEPLELQSSEPELDDLADSFEVIEE